MSRKSSCEEILLGIALGETDGEPHLVRCASCRAEAGKLRPIIRMLRSDPSIEVPAGLNASILRAFDRRKPVRSSPLSSPITMALSALATIALLTGILLALASFPMDGSILFQGIAIGFVYLAVSSSATVLLVTTRSQSHRESGSSWT